MQMVIGISIERIMERRAECLAFRKLRHSGAGVTVTVINAAVVVTLAPKQQEHDKLHVRKI